MKLPFPQDEKKSAEEIGIDIEYISHDPVIEGIMTFVEGSLAIFNSRRQVVALNSHLLNMLEIHNPGEVLGLRIGEVVSCVHALQEPEGCGSTDYCTTCGAAIAMMASLYEDREDEKTCIINREKSSEPDIVLKIKTRPFAVKNEKFILLFLQDITRDRKRAALERAFFHDITNLLSGMSGASSLLEEGGDNGKLLGIIKNSSRALRKEVEIQRYLSGRSEADFGFEKQEINIKGLFEECETLSSTHPARSGRNLIFKVPDRESVFCSDFIICQRILYNMIINALEASEKGDTVTVLGELKGEDVIFSVHNSQNIPGEIQLRIFQKNFSTKDSEGRGIGTFSMKLLGEDILGGRVYFESTPEEGTFFYFSIPLIS